MEDFLLQKRQYISDDELATFERTGFLAVEGLVAHAAEQLKTWVEELQNYPETPGKYWMYFEESRREPGKRILNRMENFLAYHEGFAELANSEAILGRTSELFGEPAVLFKEKINFKLPGSGGFEEHQDSQAGWGDYASLFISVFVGIDATTVENGCLEMGLGPHRRELIGKLWQPLTDDELSGFEFVPYPTQPGDVVFFDSFVPHRSAPNRTAKPRRCLYITYNRRSEGDHRARYYEDKLKSYPPDCEREPSKTYTYKV